MLTEMEIKVQRVLFENRYGFFIDKEAGEILFQCWLESFKANKLPEMKPAQPLTTYKYEYED